MSTVSAIWKYLPVLLKFLASFVTMIQQKYTERQIQKRIKEIETLFSTPIETIEDASELAGGLNELFK